MPDKEVTLNVADGTSMLAYTSMPDNIAEKNPAIIVLQEAFGVNSHIKNITDRFAAEGYIAIAPELFHRSAPIGFTASYNDFGSVSAHLQALTPEGMQADMQAAYDWLIEQKQTDTSKVFSVGYCMGGRASFLANVTLPLKAAVSYYGGGVLPLLNKVNELSGKHLFYWGGLDKHIPKEQVDQVTEALTIAGKPFVNVVFSNADHGFNCDERVSYNENASKDAWALTLQFLKDS